MMDFPERLMWIECVVRFIADTIHSVIELVKGLTT